jgi:hypothetical protein
MVNKVRTLDFLPEIFRTESNRQFLSATLDVLTAQPELNRVQGYIGSKFGYGINAADNYVIESTDTRSNYQLDPSVVFLKPDTQTPIDFVNYNGILKSLQNAGGIVNNHNRLFENEFYSWDPFVDYDKIVNYSQYYWLPLGPDAIEINNANLAKVSEYVFKSTSGGLTLSTEPGANPIINLVRGQTYTFKLETTDVNEQLWVQGIPGLSAVQGTTNTRNVLGVTNNGTKTITFTVPEVDAQSEYNILGNITVDLVTTKLYSEINGSSVSVIDGIGSIHDKTLLFFNSENKTDLYKITVDGNGVISLGIQSPIAQNKKIIVNGGLNFAGQIFYRNSADQIVQIPYLSSVLNKLYYQSSTNKNSYGEINIFESNTVSVINVDDIVGRKNYTSPSGITFTNGLKIKFNTNVIPAEFENGEFYVEGVGASIKLLPVTDYVVTELHTDIVFNLWSNIPWDIDGNNWDSDGYAPTTPDYITINRNSRDLNAWTRSNRWFHQTVIDTTIAATGAVSSKLSNIPKRAERPIIEFRGNLQLFNSGFISAGAVTYVDNVTTDPLVQINGNESYSVDEALLKNNDRVVFANATDIDVRRTVYLVSVILLDEEPILNLSPVSTVEDNYQVTVQYGTKNRGTTWAWSENTSSWRLSQKKTSVNQPPLFDIVDSNLISLSNTDYYPNTTFTGTKLFSYTVGSGSNDTVLGFPIQYSSVNNIGDINFTVDFNKDDYSYLEDFIKVNKSVNTGYVKHNVTDTEYEKLTGWIRAADNSFQYQVFKYDLNAEDTRIVCDIPAKLNTNWNSVQLYFDDTVLDSSEYTVTVLNNKTTIEFTNSISSAVTATLLIYSDVAAENSYYTVPSNLQSNPFNANITTVDVGDIRNQYRTIYSNASNVTGTLYGSNNIHDLGPLYQYGTSIIQSSSPMVLPGLFLRRNDVSFFDALQYNSNEYYNYKELLTDIAFKNDYSVYQTPAQILDNIIAEIISIKSNSSSFLWTDVLFTGSPYVTNTYKFEVAPTAQTFSLSRVYDFTKSNYNGIGVYLTRVVNGRSITTQLLRNIEYTVNTDSPSLTITIPLLNNDSLIINEYNQTYGSYCPSTPTTLGLYPATVPEVYLDTTYGANSYFIIGHDGSYNKLYGTYNNGILDDFRDIALLEFEKRIFNNIKTDGRIPLISEAVIPGHFRKTEYEYSETQNIYSPNFLNWVGTNRVDFKQQNYNLLNKFSYNYGQSSNKLNSSQLLQGYWRGIYRWLYDTDHPHTKPWELLGFTIKPTWWDTRYGAAPYTSDNQYMWEEISRGYIWNNGDSYIDETRIRPELLKIIPTDASGQLKNPFDVIVGNYNSLTFNRDWKVGDTAPTETAYLRSSAWPYDLMRILALTKPAKFFNLFVDMDSYSWNTEFSQYLYNDRYHLDTRQLSVYGNGQAKRSYINWIVDYVNVRGVSGHDVVTTYLRNVDVRLTYNIAGFSSKNYLKFYIERATPNSKNTSFLIPDESYTVLLYNNVPETVISYSSVILQRVKNGWTLWGNNQSQQYFKTLVPKPTGKDTILNVDGTKIRITNSWYNEREQIIPYGTLFHSQQSVCEFMNAYGQYMMNQGVKFENVDGVIQQNWTRMIEEFIAWSQQEWDYGSTISINPNARKFSVEKSGLIVQPLGIQDKNYILNQNLLPVQTQNSVVYRDNQSFSVEILNEGDTVAHTNLNMNSIEHAVIFDNNTVFNDLIYSLPTGLRQQRLILKGYKTANWSGYVDAAGFILNEDNIKEWTPNTKYSKGIIVLNKNLYWAANKLIEPSAVFNQSDWKQIDYENVKTGLLSNPSTNAYESLYYYDTYRANLKLDENLLAYSLIGYRPRDYLNAADLSDTTQVNVFKNIVTEKGTPALANSFKGTQFDQGAISYNINEIWAINTGTFGNILNSNFVDIPLDESVLNGNPTLIGFSEADPIQNVQQTVTISQFENWERPPLSNNFLPELSANETTDALPTAGYVDIRDTDYQVYEFDDLNEDLTIINTVTVNKTIWIAKYNSSWNIFTIRPVGANPVQIENNQNGTVTIVFDRQHKLKAGDHFAINNFDTLVNKFYTVSSVTSLNRVTVEYSLDDTIIKLNGFGTAMRLVSRRYAQAADAVNSTLEHTEFDTRKIWVDSDIDNRWAVWQTAPVFAEKSISIPTSVDVGKTVDSGDEIGQLFGDPTAGNVYCYRPNKTVITISGSNNFGVAIKATKNRLFIASDTQVSCYNNLITLTQVLPVANITSIAISDNNRWMYLFKQSTSTVYVYHLNSNNVYQLANTAVIANATGSVIATTTDGRKLIAGAPTEVVNGLSEAGAVYIYSRAVQRFISDGTQTEYSLVNGAPNNIADVYLNGVLTSAVTVTDNKIKLNTPAPAGITVSIETATLQLTQRLVSTQPKIGARYGHSIDTNRWGSTVVVGSPFDLNTDDIVSNIEGSVAVYINGAQRYGTITLNDPVVNSGDWFLIDGYVVAFSVNTENVNTIAATINDQTPTNIVATASDNQIVLTVLDSTAETPYDIIDIVANLGLQERLRLEPYSLTQTILSVNRSQTAEFGYAVSMNERDGLIISAPRTNKVGKTTFDKANSCVDDYTTFDNGVTTFVESFVGVGMVYAYEYLPASNESITNPGKYVFGQYIVSGDTNYGSQSRFGHSVKYHQNMILVGAPNWSKTFGGFATLFTSGVDNTDPCIPRKVTTWHIDKKPVNQVNINKINNINIFNRLTDKTLDVLDYIDPVQGKMLGAVSVNIDFISSYDPAGYEINDLQWGRSHVGTVWLDTNNLRMLNYNQQDVNYNAKYWGVAFPGSSADVYTWIESADTPLNYTGSGFPVAYDKYVTSAELNVASNTIVVRYYFWVKNYDAIPEGKTLSPLIISQYVLNPQSSGISYLAPITTNIVALYNSNQYINDSTSTLHLGYGNSIYDDGKHVSWKLVRSNSDDFLPGIPDKNNVNPVGLYLKYLDSFSGADSAGNFVPDIRLPAMVKSGVSFSPRQTMFIDRNVAVKNFINYANNILIQHPVTETRPNLSFINTNVTNTYDTRKYWKYVNWWASGYNDQTKALIEVNQYVDLIKIGDSQLITGINGLVLALKDGLIVKVKSNSQGLSEHYVYKNSQWTRIGVENGTIQFLTTLWEQIYGWDTDLWGTQWDGNPSKEVYWIIRWINEVLYTDDLLAERNNSLMLMFNYSQSEILNEKNYNQWLMKTSMIDVNHTIRKLSPYKKYQRDNTEFLSGYLNEIKPFHVYIKDFVYAYDGIDTARTDVTDFDLPAQYNNSQRKFITPQLRYSGNVNVGEYMPTSNIWSDTDYVKWFENYGLSLSESVKEPIKVATLAEKVLDTATAIRLSTVYGLQAGDVIIIDDEQIQVNNVDRISNRVTGLTRGYNSTVISEHKAKSNVFVAHRSSFVLDSGRGYDSTEELISITSDTVNYPSPRQEIVLSPAVANTRITSINTVNSGGGYSVAPEIKFLPSNLYKEFSGSNVNATTNTITINNHGFETGDSVIYTNTSTINYGLKHNSYYYVRAINANTIALYQNYKHAADGGTQFEQKQELDARRVKLKSSSSTVLTRLSIIARAQFMYESYPIRTIKTTIAFDRVSYTARDDNGWDNSYYYWDVLPWDGEEDSDTAATRIKKYYTPTVNMPGKDLRQLMSGVIYPNSILSGIDFAPAIPVTPDIEIESPVDETETDIIVDGGDFIDGYGPEELVSGYVTDTVNITVTTDPTKEPGGTGPTWTHRIFVNYDGKARAYSNSNQRLAWQYLKRWWYGSDGGNPANANTTLTADVTNTAATFLKS